MLLTLLFHRKQFSESLVLLIMQGTRLCSYYMCSGMCEFGSNCKFHHPEPESEHENCDASRHAIQGSSQLNFSSGLDQEALKEQSVPFLAPSPSCRRSGVIPSQGVYPYPECTGYQVTNTSYLKKYFFRLGDCHVNGTFLMFVSKPHSKFVLP